MLRQQITLYQNKHYNNYININKNEVVRVGGSVGVQVNISSYFVSHELQFAFKKGIGCQNAVFTVQQVVSYFNQRELPCELPCVASPAGCPPERPRAQRINP